MAKNYVTIIRQPGKAPVVTNQKGEVIRDYSKAVPPSSQAGQAMAINQRRDIENKIAAAKYGDRPLSEAQYATVQEEAKKYIPPPAPRTSVIQPSNLFGTSNNKLQPGQTEIKNQPTQRQIEAADAGNISYVDVKTGKPVIAPEKIKAADTGSVSYVDIKTGMPKPAPREIKAVGEVSYVDVKTGRNVNPLQGLNAPTYERPSTVPILQKPTIPNQMLPFAQAGEEAVPASKEYQENYRRGSASALGLATAKVIGKHPYQTGGLLILGGAALATGSIFTGGLLDVALLGGSLLYAAGKPTEVGTEYERLTRTKKEQQAIAKLGDEAIFGVGQPAFLGAIAQESDKLPPPKNWLDKVIRFPAKKLPVSIPFIGGMSFEQIAYSNAPLSWFKVGSTGQTQLQLIYSEVERQYPGKFSPKEKEMIAERVQARTVYEQEAAAQEMISQETGANIFLKKFISPSFLSKNLVTKAMTHKELLTRIGWRTVAGSAAESVPTIIAQQSQTTSPKMKASEIAIAGVVGGGTSGIINWGIGYGTLKGKPLIRGGSAFVGYAIDFPAEIIGDTATELNMKAMKRFGLAYEETSMISKLGKEKNLGAFATLRRGTEIVIEPTTPLMTGVQTKSKEEGKITSISRAGAEQSAFNNYLNALTRSNQPVVSKAKGANPKVPVDLLGNPLESSKEQQAPPPVPVIDQIIIPEDIKKKKPEYTIEPDEQIKEQTKQPINENTQSKQNLPIDIPVQSNLYTTVFSGGGFIPPLPFSIPGGGSGGMASKGRQAYINELAIGASLLRGFGIQPQKQYKQPKVKKGQKQSKQKKPKRMTIWQMIR